MKSLSLSLISAPLDLGAENLGVDIGPEAFRHANIIGKLEGTGLEVQDEGSIDVTDRKDLDRGNPRLHYLDEIVRVNEALAAKTHAAVKTGRAAVVIGGDHSVNLGAVAGASVALGGEIGVIYFDAHGDMNTDE